jgi:REP element-mobilizing transposase RayT
MARQRRIQYEGAIYHLLSRGDRREEIFQDNLDRKSFLQVLGAACKKTGWQVHAYCLMSNHFHLVIGDAAGKSGRGDEMAAGHVQDAF